MYYSVIIMILLLTGCSNEKNDWQNAKTKNTVQLYDDFIKNYPESIFKDSAVYKIEKLNYEEVVGYDNLNEYHKFIQQYPNSIFLDSIKDKIVDLNIRDAQKSKDIMQVVDYINNYPSNKMIIDFLITPEKIIEIKGPQKFNDDLTTAIKTTDNGAKMTIELRIPPNRKITSDLSVLKNWKTSGAGTIVQQMSIGDGGKITGTSYYATGKNGLSLVKEISTKSIIPVTSKFIEVDSTIILKISENEFIYSTSDDTRFQQVGKTNGFNLIEGVAYHINLN